MDLELLQRVAAEQIGTKVDNLVNWEQGKNVPEVRFIPGIIRFLGYNPFPVGETLAEQIRAGRERLGLSQRRLAALLSVDPSTVWKWERQGRRPSAKIAKRLLEYLPLTSKP